MKLLAFAATTSSQSINKQIVAYATRLLEDGLVRDVDIETIDLGDYEMPIYSFDRERSDGVPEPARDFYAKVGDADAVLISFAEHNGFYTAAYKNLFDWVSRIDMRVYQGKPAVLFATSPGGRGGRTVLETAVSSGRFFGYEVLASLSIPSFSSNFDQVSGSISDPQLDAEFRAALATLEQVDATGR